MSDQLPDSESYQPSPFHAVTRCRDPAQPQSAVGMANSACKGIRRIRAGATIKLQQPLHHFLYLFFFRMTLADHRLLDLQCGIFGENDHADRRTNRRAAGLPQHQRRFWIDVDKHLLHRDLFWTVLCNDFIEMIHDALQAQRQLIIRCFDTTAANVRQLAASLIDNPETCDAQTGVYAKDTDFFYLLKKAAL